MAGEHRGGHIPGATSLDVKWANYIDWIEIVRSKGLKEYDNLVLYGYNTDDCMRVASCFKKFGYKRVAIYTRFTEEWSANEELPLERLPRFRNLVPPHNG